MVRSALRHKETQVIIANLVVGNLFLFIFVEQANLEKVISALHVSISITAIILLLVTFKILKKYPGVIAQASCALVISFLIPVLGSSAVDLIFGAVVGLYLIITYKWMIVFMTVFNTILFRWLEKGRFPEE